jgi:hypothetical protein
LTVRSTNSGSPIADVDEINITFQGGFSADPLLASSDQNRRPSAVCMSPDIDTVSGDHLLALTQATIIVISYKAP